MPSAEDPLLPDELAKLREAASKPSVRLPVAIVPATGLWPPEFAHLHSDWITFASDQKGLEYHTITIPDEDPCRRKKAVYGSESGGLMNTKFNKRDQPCDYCTAHGGEGYFTAPHRDDSNRTITITDEHAAELLKWWFTKFDTVPWGYIRDSRLRRVALHILDRPINLTGLRHTFAARAAAMGLDLDVVMDYMGINGDYPTSRLYQILVEHSAKGANPDDILNQRTYHSYLTLLNDHGPLAAREIADHFDIRKSSARRTISKYEKIGLAERTQESIRGVQPTLWTNTVEPGTPVECEHEGCDKEFYSLERRSKHTTNQHE